MDCRDAEFASERQLDRDSLSLHLTTITALSVSVGLEQPPIRMVAEVDMVIVCCLGDE